MNTEQQIDLETLCKWSRPKEVETKNGPRILRTGRPDEAFWEVWTANQQTLKLLGVSVGRDRLDPSKWSICHWAKLDPAVIEQRAKNVEMSKATDANIEVPAPEGCVYMPFQKAGIAYAQQHPGCLIGDSPGLGKTIQAIGLINLNPDISRILIVCPLTLAGNWERELKKWLVRPMTIGIANSQYWPRTDIVLIHYQIVRKFPSRLTNYWDLLVCDEAHRLGNRKSLQTKAVLGYQPTKKEIATGVQCSSGIPAKRKLFLSGTPFENCPAEIFGIIHYLDPETWPSRWKFEARYCGGMNNGFGYEAKGATNLEELSEKLRASVMIRRRKEEVLKELPPKTRVIVEMDATGFEHVIQNEKKVWHQHEGELEDMQAEMELAKASDNPDKFKASVENLRKKAGLIFTEIARVRHDTALAKTPKMIEMLQDEIAETGRKLVVFGHHTDVLRAAHAAFRNSVIITGDTPQIERDQIVQRFQKDPACGPFFGSIRATGEGITLTASSTVIFFENDWTASKMAQCSDRCHRIGQRDNVLVKYWILPGTIDAHMIKTWIRKEEILEKALDSERAELAQEATIMPKAEPLATKTEIERDALSITTQQAWAIHQALKVLAGRCDGARQLDGAGFNKIDSRIGKSLSEQGSITVKQAALGRKILQKYGHQLGEDVLEKCGITLKENP